MNDQDRRRRSPAVSRLGTTVLLLALPLVGGCDPLGVDAEDPLDRFAFTVRMETRGMAVPIVVEQRGVVVVPDREEIEQEMTIGSFTMGSETLAVEGRRWVTEDMPFIEPGLTPTLSFGSDRGDAVQAALAALVDSRPGAPEVVNGEAALRYDLTPGEFVLLALSAAAVPAGATAPDASLWVAEETGMPLRLVLETPADAGSRGATLQLDITDTDASLDVTLPDPSELAPGQQPLVRVEPDGPQIFDSVKAALGAAIGVVTGVDPFSVEEAVSIVEENAEALNETKENAEEYFDAFPDPDEPDRDRYTLADEDLSDKSWVYTWFWGWFE